MIMIHYLKSKLTTLYAVAALTTAALTVAEPLTGC